MGWEGLYEVSSLGRVRSVDRVDSAGATRKGRVLRSGDQLTGHQVVHLSRASQVTTRTVHRLVLEAFVGPRPEGMEACHWDGNPRNNRRDNLRWGTRSSNRQDAVRHGTHFAPGRYVTHCPRGHEYLPWNLCPGEYRRGLRVCRSCRNSRARAVKRGDRDYYRDADSIYQDLKTKEGQV